MLLNCVGLYENSDVDRLLSSAWNDYTYGSPSVKEDKLSLRVKRK
jgi:hypothetical protein